MRSPSRSYLIILTVLFAEITLAAFSAPIQGNDHYRLRSVSDVEFSPDGRYLVYTVVNNDQPGHPHSQLWVFDQTSGLSRALVSDGTPGSSPLWSPDNTRVAYAGREGDRSGWISVRADGSERRFLAEVRGTNHPVPSTGQRASWSPDGRSLAFISAVEGPEAEETSGDPVVIRRYLYKPTASEGSTRFNDNRRLHIFVVDVETLDVRQLTRGSHYEHSIDWSPDGQEILFVSNREPDPERVFNYDIFAVRVSDGTIRQITHTETVEYRPQWSPDGRQIAYQGTRRGLTSSETTMEDTHLWVINADGSGRTELGRGIDNRQGAPGWTRDSRSVYFTVQERGNVKLLKLAASGGGPDEVIAETGSVGAWSVGPDESVAFTFHSPQDLPQLHLLVRGENKKLTDLNAEAFQNRQIAEVEAFQFVSFDGKEVEAFLTKPPALGSAQRSHPLIVMIKGGPHGQQGPGFNLKAQSYASRGWAVLMVNYRGSTGYGQAFTDAIFGDQNGGEAKDVLYGLEAALRRFPWIDRDRLGVEGGSYGGQLTNWLITQTHRFKAAIPIAGISNLVSFNYMAYYHDYLAVEFGAFPHQENLMDRLWERSPLRYVAQVKTPTMFVHGENDNDVPIAEAEQYYIALKDVGVETIMVRYPREGHGVRESGHVVDLTERSIDWYQKHFRSGGQDTVSSTGQP